MNKRAVLLALSLAANAALVATFYFRPSTSHSTASESTTTTTVAKKESGQSSSVEIATLDTGNLTELKNAGVPDKVARNLILGRAYARLNATERTLVELNPADGRYWARQKYFSDWSKETRVTLTNARREFANVLRELGAEKTNYDWTNYGFEALPAVKREKLRRIQQDYEEIRDTIDDSAGGVQLTSDLEKARLLYQEQERDIAAILSPEEWTQYVLHTSPTSRKIRHAFGDAIQNENDYKKIYALQEAYDNQFAKAGLQSSGSSPEITAARRAADLKLQADILAVIGEENFANFQHSSDQEYKALTSIVKRLNLPTNTANNIYSRRDAYALQSQQINQNTALSVQDRRTQFNSLADTARIELQATLGAEGMEAYTTQTNWLYLLKRGSAFSTDPKGHTTVGTTVYPLPLPPAP